MGGRGLILLYLAGGTLGNVVHVAGQALQEQRLGETPDLLAETVKKLQAQFQ